MRAPSEARADLKAICSVKVGKILLEKAKKQL